MWILEFAMSYLCEAGFSAVAVIKSKYHAKINLGNRKCRWLSPVLFQNLIRCVMNRLTCPTNYEFSMWYISRCIYVLIFYINWLWIWNMCFYNFFQLLSRLVFWLGVGWKKFWYTEGIQLHTKKKFGNHWPNY